MDTQERHPVLSAEKLTIGYPLKGNADIVVAEALDLELQQGELVCLLGSNGTGKSTLIRTLSGMATPLSGQVTLEGKPIDQLTPKERARKISLVLTDTISTGMMSAYALVSLGRHPYTNWSGTLSPHDHERVQWALDAVKSAHLSHRHIGELSDGERQKIMLARALAQDAPIMLLDEPTAYLDLPRRVELMSLLRDLAHRENLSILLSTHDLDLALRCADRLWLYNSDKTITQGPPEALALNGAVAQSFASDTLEWDTELGSFRLHRDPSAFVTICGDNPATTWTRRALARLGYGIAQEGSDSAFSIEVNKEWIVHIPKGTETFSTLHAFIIWLQNHSH